MTKDGKANPADGAAFKWEPLVNALRAELQEFGGLLRLLNTEQDGIFAAPALVAKAPEAIALQHALALKCTQMRIDEMQRVARVPGSRHVSEDQVLAVVPADVRPLMSALFAEVKKLAFRADDRTSQNDWLRKRAPVLAATMAGRGSEDR